MATLTGNTLSIAYQGEGSLYVIARQVDDGQVFNGTGLETFDADNLATYAIGLGSQGGDFHSADVPAALPAGVFQFTFYELEDDEPGEADLILSSPVYKWNGTTGSPPDEVETPEPSGYALTTLAQVKALMRITGTSKDVLLVQLINAVSAQVETITGRQFKARDYRVRLNGVNQRTLSLPQYPVQHITRIAYGNTGAVTLKFTGQAIRANATVFIDPESSDAGGLRLYSVNSAGVPSTVTLAFDVYPATALLVAQINAAAGWLATLQRNVPTADLFPLVLNNCQASTQDLRYPDVDIHNYTVNERAGLVRFEDRSFGPFVHRSGYSRTQGVVPFPPGHQYITVQYRAGFDTVPGDLSQIVAEMVKDAHDSTKRDGTIKGRTIGPYSAQYDVAGLAESMKARLGPWMNASQLVGGGS